MENELIGVFRRTLDAHFPEEVGFTRAVYASTFEKVLRREIRETAVRDVASGAGRARGRVIITMKQNQAQERGT
jgi:hypothetical protein